MTLKLTTYQGESTLSLEDLIKEIGSEERLVLSDGYGPIVRVKGKDYTYEPYSLDMKYEEALKVLRSEHRLKEAFSFTYDHWNQPWYPHMTHTIFTL